MANYDLLKPETKEKLTGSFTNLEDDVFFFDPSVPPNIAATIMAMTSRQEGDIRSNFGKFFVESSTLPKERAERIIDYGDDSVAQLAYVQGGVERVSNLGTKQLEWSREGDYIEQSTRYIAYDGKDAEGNYFYKVPPEVSTEDTPIYRSLMNRIFSSYSEALDLVNTHLLAILPKDQAIGQKQWQNIVKAQACDAVRAMLPSATTSNVGMVFSAQGIEHLVLHLKAHPLQEMQILGGKVLEQARLVIPEFLTRVDLPDRGEEWQTHKEKTRLDISEIATTLGLRQAIPNYLGRASVKLLGFTPDDELDVVPGLLFAESTVSMEEVERAVAGMTRDEKLAVLRAYVGERKNRRHKPGRAMELPHYRWEVVQDYGSFRDLQRHRKLDMPEWQEASPFHGRVEVPEVVKQAGAEHLFESVFSDSMALYRILKDTYGPEVAQYATLLGHNVRWTFMENAREAFHLHELRTQPAGHPQYRQIVQEMHRQVARVHPTIADSMNYVNFKESPVVSRLGEALGNESKRRKAGYQ